MALAQSKEEMKKKIQKFFFFEVNASKRTYTERIFRLMHACVKNNMLDLSNELKE